MKKPEPKTKRGAPPGNQNAAKEDTLTSTLHIRCKPEEKGIYDRAARRQGKKTSVWIREVLNVAANN